MKRTRPRFPLGRLVATRGALALLSGEDIALALSRHVQGDWGELEEEDRQANEHAIGIGERLLSVYHTSRGTKFYIITEWDRSLTTILLPEDLIGLPNYKVYLRLLIDGQPSIPFSAETLPMV